LKFDEELFRLRVFNVGNEEVEFETLADPAKDGSLLKSFLPQPYGGVLPASRVMPEIPASSERQTLRSTSEPALASPCDEVLTS
jgi:hypothetical protein